MEAIVALALASVVILVVYTVLSSTLLTYNKMEASVQLRDETNVVMARMNQEFLNLHSVTATNQDAGGSFTSFTYTMTDTSGQTHTKSIAILPSSTSGSSNVVMTDNDTNQSTIVNQTKYSFEGTTFTLSANQLLVNLSAKEAGKLKVMHLYTAYAIH